MAYIKTDWVNDSTPLNAANMNHIEDGIEGAYNEIATKADAVAVEEALALKANIADVYNKNDTDALLATKANADDVYTKQESYNKTKVDELLAEKQDALTFDTTPTEGSTNPVTSDGIYKAIDSATPHEGTITNDMLAGGITGDKLAQSTKDLFDAAGTAASVVGEHNVSDTAHTDIRQEVASKADLSEVYTKSQSYSKTEIDGKLDGKQNTLTFDNTPTNGSPNPVTSDGIYDALALKANSADVYTKSEVYTQTETDNLLSAKADSSNVYTKSETYTQTEVDTLLSAKANSTDVYTKTETNNLLAGKANTADVYTKQETDTELAKKQNKLTFDETPTDGSVNPVTSNGVYDALALKANSSNVYTKSQVYTKSEMNSALSGKQSTLTFDNAPINGSTNPVTSDGIYDALAVKANASTVNEALALKADADSVYTKQETYTQSQVGTLLNNGINTHNTSNTAHADIRETLSQKANSADVYTKSETDTLLGTKQDTLTFDTTPTAGSTNPVTSEGIKSAIDDGLSGYVPTSRTIAGLDLTQNRSAQEITDSLIYCNSTTDIDYIMGDNQ